MRALLIPFLLLWITTPAFGQELEGVSFPETITTSDSTTLHLNGVGVRTKFIFDIYVTGLYLEQVSKDENTIISTDGQRLMRMHFLYKEVGQKKLVKGWNNGFAKNLSRDELEPLAAKIEAFNNLFSTVHKGDEILLAYNPATGTTVTINNTEMGIISGKEFNDGLMKIWLGDKPVTGSLKKALLGLE